MTANEMFEKLGYKLINDKNIVYKETHFTGRIIHIAFFSDKQILITQSSYDWELLPIITAIINRSLRCLRSRGLIASINL